MTVQDLINLLSTLPATNTVTLVDLNGLHWDLEPHHVQVYDNSVAFSTEGINLSDPAN